MRTVLTDWSADCNDSNQYVWLQATGTNIDSDRDGYEVGNPGSAVSRCIGAMTTISGRRYYNSTDNTYDFQVWSDRIGSNDCLDSASSVNPGVTAWFTTAGPNNWDYDCSGGSVKRYSTGGSCSSCINDDPSWCWDYNEGNRGYTGSSPACGSAGNYINTEGMCIDAGGYCDVEPPCSQISRTQQCH